MEKRNPVARWGTETTGLELNKYIITQHIVEIKGFLLYIGKKGGNHGTLHNYHSGSGGNADYIRPGLVRFCADKESV